jgi:FkbM family methyltransferase
MGGLRNLWFFSFFILFTRYIMSFSIKKRGTTPTKYVLKTPLDYIHAKLLFKNGSLKDELVEQTLAVKYIKPTDIVLEFGGNIGRNSCVIASILNDSKNLTVFETDPINAKDLEENKVINNLHFNIIPKALSKDKLIQKGWDSKPWSEDVIPNGWSRIQSMTFEEFKTQFPEKYNVLVCDCEGAMYYIFRDYPEILDNVRLIIMENDYKSMDQYNFVYNTLQKNFKCIFTEKLNGRLGPCDPFFYQVWERI